MYRSISDHSSTRLNAAARASQNAWTYGSGRSSEVRARIIESGVNGVFWAISESPKSATLLYITPLPSSKSSDGRVFRAVRPSRIRSTATHASGSWLPDQPSALRRGETGHRGSPGGRTEDERRPREAGGRPSAGSLPRAPRPRVSRILHPRRVESIRADAEDPAAVERRPGFGSADDHLPRRGAV